MCIYRKDIAYIGFGPICGFRHVLGVLDCLPVDKGGQLYSSSTTSILQISAPQKTTNTNIFALITQFFFLFSIFLKI